MSLKPITVETANVFKGIVIGVAGIGKTSLIRTIPENERVCVVSAEAGLLCVADLVKCKRIEGFEIGSFSEMAEVFNYLMTPEAREKFQWVFIDSLTEISSRCVEAMKAKYPNKSDSFNLWGEYTDKMTGLIKAYRDIPFYNVVFTCLEQVEQDDLKRRFYGPSISGSGLKERLPSYFDEVLYMTSLKNSEGQEYRAFICQPWDKYPAKDRSGKLSITEMPSLSSIKSKIIGGN